MALALLGAACGGVTDSDEAPNIGTTRAPISAQDPFDGSSYYIMNKNSGKCVDDTNWGTTNGTALQQYGCGSAQDNQLWKLRPTGDGYYNILSVHAPWLGWDVTGGPGATGAGVKVHLWGIGGSGNANQQWDVQTVRPPADGAGLYTFVARHSGKCLDVPNSSINNGVVLQQWGCNGTDAQRFFLVDPGEPHGAR